MITKNNARSVEQEAISILESDSEEKEDQLDQLAAKNNITIYVTDTSGNALYNCEYIATTKMSTLPNEEFLRYYKEAQDHGGSTVIEFKGNHNKTFEKQNGDTESSTEAVFAPQPPKEDSSIPQPPEADGFVQNYGQDMAESIIYVDVLTSDNTACVLMVNTVLTPVSATVDTLRIQLIWITVVMIILSLLIALVISKKVSRSMIRVNNAAQKLAKGDFNVLDISKLQAGALEMKLSQFNLTDRIQKVLERYNKLKEQIVRIEVIDSGEGISEENLPYVWDRYYKVDKTHKRAVMGTGLGLSIVKNILELHHAEYGVESILSAGSKFWFELPVIEKEEI